MQNLSIIGSGKVGSTLLFGTISAHPQVGKQATYCGEPLCHLCSVFRYYHPWLQHSYGVSFSGEPDDLLLPGSERRNKISTPEYAAYVYSQQKLAKWLYYHLLQHQPLIYWLRDNTKTIHITRRNYVATYVSVRIWQEFGYDVDYDKIDKKISLSTVELNGYLKRWLAQEHHIDSVFGRRCFKIQLEELLYDWDEVQKQLWGFLELDQVNIPLTHHRKTDRETLSMIENSEQVVEFLRRTGYQSFADDLEQTICPTA